MSRARWRSTSSRAASTQSGPEAAHQVDALSGATLTSNGVENLLQFWLGETRFRSLS